MGTDKALLEFHGQTWVEHQAAQIRASGCVEKLILVDQPGKSFLYERLMKHLDPSGFLFELAENNQKDSQPFDSIRIGLSLVPEGHGSFISPVDVPLHQTILKLLWKECDAVKEAVKPSYHHQGGHPIWMSPKAIAKFKSHPRRLDEFLAEIKVDFVEIQDERVRLNLNTPEEWQAYVSHEASAKSR